jgi:hypothetical protein
MAKQLAKHITLINLKIAVAIILFVSLFLPFSSCSKVVDKHGKTIPYTAQNGELKQDPDLLKDSRTVTTIRYILTSFEIDNEDHWMLLLGFIWPWPLLMVRRRLTGKLTRRALFVAEPGFAAFACWIIFSESLFGPEIGAWTSLSANIALFVLWLIEAVLSFRIIKLAKTEQKEAGP